jgi:hypothetical protein
MYSLLLPAFGAARMFTESLLSNDDIPLLLNMFTELLPGNALVESVTILYKGDRLHRLFVPVIRGKWR